MKHNKMLLDRLKESVGEKSGCSPLFLKVLKSDLARLLEQYMALEGLEVGIVPSGSAFALRVECRVHEFFELGKNIE